MPFGMPLPLDHASLDVYRGNRKLTCHLMAVFFDPFESAC